MKCNPWRWLWGLIPVLMLGWIAVLGERERIETDLTRRTQQVLERSGFGWATVAFEGRDAVLSGRAGDDGEPAKAVAAALDTMGVRIVDNRASLIDIADRYEWSAIRRDNRIRVDGLVPSEKTRRDVIGMVKANFPSLEVDDRMKLARGAPPLDAWLGGVGFGLKQLALLREGRVDLEQTSLTVRGDALDVRSYRSIKTALAGQLPQGTSLKSETVRPPVVVPYTWSARRQGKDVQLAGHVPNEAARDTLMRAARGLAPDAKVVDRTEPGTGAPEGFADVARALIEQLGRMDDGTAQIRDKTATLNGMTETIADADAIRGAMGRGVLASYRTSGEIKHREPLIRAISPYTTGAEVRADGVVLTGYVPDDKARAAVLALVRERFAGRRVRDELQLGTGQPPGWDACVEIGLDALQRLGNGKAQFVGRRLDVSGTTDVEPLAQSLPAEVRGKAGSSCDTDVRIALDLSAIEVREQARRRAEEEQQRARLEAERRRAEDEQRRAQAEADRRRADEDQRRAQLAQSEADRRRAEEEQRRAQAAQAEADRRRADDEQRRAQAAQAEADRRRAAEDEQRRQQAAQVEAERRRADDEQRRAAQAEADRRRAEDERRRLAAAQPPPATQGTPAQTEQARIVSACQDALSQVTREGIINFKRASWDLDPASYPTLNRLAQAVNLCPTVMVEIEGHTDAEGTDERNQRLSDRRANAVREYLARAGVDDTRLVAIGYGAKQAIATNDTPEGRAKNRRIEFTVKSR